MTSMDYHIKCHKALTETDPSLPEEDWHRACCACKAIEEKTGGWGWIGFRNWSEQGYNYPGEYECRMKFDSVPPMGGLTTLEDVQANNPL